MQTGYEQRNPCGVCMCGEELKTEEVHVCAKCAKFLLEGETSEIIRRETDG